MSERAWRMPAPRRIVVGARAYNELIEGIKRARPDLELRGAPHVELSAADLDWGEAYLGFKRPLTPTWGGIKWVHCTGAGVDSFLYGDVLPTSILLTRTSEPFGPAIAEFAVSRALAFTQNLRVVERQQRDRVWKSVP